MRSGVSILALSVIVLAVGGCADPAHEQRVALRFDNMRRTLDWLEMEEARRPENLAKTAEVARIQHERDIEKFQRDLRVLGEGIAYEFQRFEERQPEYQRRIAEQLRGKPETIERTLPYLLY